MNKSEAQPALAHRLVNLTNDPDTGSIDQGHTCKHGIRWPHECQPCADDAWERHILETSQAASPVSAAKYIPVRCLECGWKDGLREDLVKAGVMFIYCEQCNDMTVSELIHD